MEEKADKRRSDKRISRSFIQNKNTVLHIFKDTDILSL